jgi:preprotein translocase subunit Sec61beta
MGIFRYFDERARRLGVVDTKLAQGAAIFLALLVVKAFPRIMYISAWWFAGLMIVFAIHPLITFYGSGPRER